MSTVLDNTYNGLQTKHRDFCKLPYWLHKSGWMALTREASNAKVVQVITAWNFTRFLTPDMAAKNDARHGIDCSLLGKHNAMSGIVLLRHVWRQKANKLLGSNNLHKSGWMAFTRVLWTKTTNPNPTLNVSKLLRFDVPDHSVPCVGNAFLHLVPCVWETFLHLVPCVWETFLHLVSNVWETFHNLVSCVEYVS